MPFVPGVVQYIENHLRGTNPPTPERHQAAVAAFAIVFVAAAVAVLMAVVVAVDIPAVVGLVPSAYFERS